MLQVTHVQGHGCITGTNEVTVTGSDGDSRVIPTNNILIATGSVPLPFPGLEVGVALMRCRLLMMQCV